MGRYEEAEYEQKALAIWEEVLEAKHPDLAQSYNNIGMTYWSMGRYEEALAFHQKAGDPRRSFGGHASFSGILQQYWIDVLVYSRTKRLCPTNKSLGIREEVLEAKHPNLVNSYNSIGMTYLYMAATKKPVLHQKALAIREEV